MPPPAVQQSSKRDLRFRLSLESLAIERYLLPIPWQIKVELKVVPKPCPLDHKWAIYPLLVSQMLGLQIVFVRDKRTRAPFRVNFLGIPIRPGIPAWQAVGSLRNTNSIVAERITMTVYDITGSEAGTFSRFAHDYREIAKSLAPTVLRRFYPERPQRSAIRASTARLPQIPATPRKCAP